MISNGELLLIEGKTELMQKLGKKQLIIEFKEPAKEIPASLVGLDVKLSTSGTHLSYTYDASSDVTGITRLLNLLSETDLQLKDLQTTQSSLEDIFVNLVKNGSKQPSLPEA